MSAALKALAAAVVVTILTFFFGILILVPVVAGTQAAGVDAAVGVLSIDPSADAIADIPPILLPIYVDAATACPGLPWTVIAGIAKVESNHGRFAGASIDAQGNVRPPIIGIPLNGQNNTAVIGDTDNGVLDGDTVYDRAVGPFQFIPGSWAIFGVDGNGDGVKDPHNVYDAVPAAVRHLCPNGEITDLEAAIFGYNRSTTYVNKVLAWAETYTGAVSAVPVAGYANPINGLSFDQIIRPHHDYPATDIGVPVGTPTFAMVDGTVVTAIDNAGIYPRQGGKCGNTVSIEGIDGVRYTYCHLSALTVTSGQTVIAGQQVGNTGGQPGAPGAGNTTGPHLHLSMKGGGRTLCPQPIMLAISNGSPINPIASPSSGCISRRPQTNWVTWLERNAVAN